MAIISEQAIEELISRDSKLVSSFRIDSWEKCIRTHGNHRWTQIGREPRCSVGMSRKWRGLDADAFVVYMFIVSVLPRGQG